MPTVGAVLAWYRCPVPRQYLWTTFSHVTFQSHVGGRPCLWQQYTSTESVLEILLRFWRSTKPVVNFYLGSGGKVRFTPIFTNGTVPRQLYARSNACTGQLIPRIGLARYWHSIAPVLRPSVG